MFSQRKTVRHWKWNGKSWKTVNKASDAEEEKNGDKTAKEKGVMYDNYFWAVTSPAFIRFYFTFLK